MSVYCAGCILYIVEVNCCTAEAEEVADEPTMAK